MSNSSNYTYLNPYDPVCTEDQWAASGVTGAYVTCLTHGETVGLTLTVVAAYTSLTAVAIAFALIIRNVIYRQTKERRLISQPMDVFMLSLLCANLVQALGHCFDVFWLNSGRIEVGRMCSVEGVVQQLGETNVALATTAISLETFVEVWFGKGGASLFLAWLIVGVSWGYVIIFIAVTVGVLGNQDYEMPGYWCWIGDKYTGEQLAGEYVWFWVALGTSIAVYIPLHLWSRGNITIDDPSKWLGFKVHRARPAATGDSLEISRRQSYPLVAYPLTYAILVMPLSIVRWITFIKQKHNSHGGVGFQAHYAVNFLFVLSGLIDVFLLFYFRQGLLLFSDRPESSPTGRAPSPTPTDKVKYLEDGHGSAVFEMNSDDGASGRVRREVTRRLPPMAMSMPEDDGDGGWDIPNEEADITGGHAVQARRASNDDNFYPPHAGGPFVSS